MDAYFIDGLRETEEDGIFRVDDDEAEFWTVYRRDHDGCGMAMFDLLFKEEAEKLVQMLEERDTLLAAQQRLLQPVDELVMQIRRLVQALKKANPDCKLPQQVTDYMRHKGFFKVTDALR